MDNSLYKDLEVDRGLIYRYYYSPSTDGKPVLLFLHGFARLGSANRTFPTEGIWHRGTRYGRTSPPLDMKAFRLNLMTKGIVEIMNNERIDKVVGVGHDWSVPNFILYRCD